MRISIASSYELVGRLSEYKSRILTTIEELEKAVEEGDKQHTQILFDRLEEQVIAKSRR
jgi:ribosomal protein S20